MGRGVTAAAAGATALAVHTAVNGRLLRRPPPAAEVTELVSVLIPVRDEEHQVARCLRRVLDQQGLAALEVLVFDDGSTDRTARLVRQVAADRVRLLSGPAPPPGWTGKAHACHRLAERAGGRVLVFLDADVELRPGALARAVRLLRDSGLALVSPYPRLLADGLGPRLVQPLLAWSWLTFLPLRLAERPRPTALAAAGGQFLIVDAAAYRAAGGHRGVRGRLPEDMALLRSVKRAGYRGVVVDGSGLADCRMYQGWADLVDGHAKWLWPAVGGAPGAAAVAGLLGCLYLLPPVAAARGSAAGAVGYLAGVAGRAAAARRTGGRVWPDSLAQPLSVAALVWLLSVSGWRYTTGRVRWKGRRVR